jgi:hypothetical protein
MSIPGRRIAVEKAERTWKDDSIAGSYRTEVSASFELSEVYIGPLIMVDVVDDVGRGGLFSFEIWS